MTSQAKIEANRRNSLKSTGPKTPEGLARSSMNALKHGMRSKKQALLDEDSYAFENRLHKWVSIADPEDDVGEFLVHQYVSLSFQLDHLERARVERLTSAIENSDETELDAVHELGRRLFFDSSGPTPLYGNRLIGRTKTKTSWNGAPLDPNDPAVLVRKLESTAAGCHWLRRCWEELRGQLEPGKFWQSQDRLKAVRLLGRQPLDAIEDRRVAEIFLASRALSPAGGGAFDDLSSEIGTGAHEHYQKEVKARWSDLPSREEPEQCRKLLLHLVDHAIERLEAKLEVYEENADVIAERTVARLSFDPSPEGETMRRHQMRCTNAFFRAIEMYRKYQRDKRAEGNRTGWSPDDSPRRIPDAARWPQHMNAYDRVPRDTFGVGDTPAQAFEPPVDSDALPERAGPPDSENATNEPNFTATAINIQEHEAVGVAANESADSALDNYEAQPSRAEGSDRAPESEISDEGPCGVLAGPGCSQERSDPSDPSSPGITGDATLTRSASEGSGQQLVASSPGLDSAPVGGLSATDGP
jgi:hypothetical protein